jgi:hypothetical protein
MGFWDYRNLKRTTADIFSTSFYGRPRSKNISPAKIYYEKLKGNKKFKRLYGFSDWTYSMNADGSHYRQYYRYRDHRQFPSDWYCYRGKGNRRAIIQMPEYSDLNNRVFLKILWVPREQEKKGIATEVMRELMRMTDEVDALAKSEERYKDNYITGSSFVLTLIPNSFVVRKDHWNIEDIATGKDLINWTASPQSEADDIPDATMCDEVNAYLPKDELRMSLKQLEKFYIGKLGFVKCLELAFSEDFDWNTGRINRQLNITGRSVAHQRYPLLYPAENLGDWEREEQE